MIDYQETQFGFEWGAATVDRVFSDTKTGCVTISIRTPKEDLQIYVTKTGKVRVHGKDRKEWKPK